MICDSRYGTICTQDLILNKKAKHRGWSEKKWFAIRWNQSVRLVSNQLALANKTTNGSSSGEALVAPAPPSYEEATAGMARCWIRVVVMGLNKQILSKTCCDDPFRRQCSLLQWCWDAHRIQLGWSQHQEGLHPKGMKKLNYLKCWSSDFIYFIGQYIEQILSFFFLRCTASWWSSSWLLSRSWLCSHSGEHLVEADFFPSILSCWICISLGG